MSLDQLGFIIGFQVMGLLGFGAGFCIGYVDGLLSGSRWRE